MLTTRTVAIVGPRHRGVLRWRSSRPLCHRESTTCARNSSGAQEITAAVGMPLIYKSSYDKANRTAAESYRGPGLRAGLAILQRAREIDVPVLSDVHGGRAGHRGDRSPGHHPDPGISLPPDRSPPRRGRYWEASEQKGQFLAPWDMQHVAQKLASTGNQRLLLTERGASFGYNNLVADMRSCDYAHLWLSCGVRCHA